MHVSTYVVRERAVCSKLPRVPCCRHTHTPLTNTRTYTTHKHTPSGGILHTEAGTSSSCLPPWLETMMPWTLCFKANSASSFVKIPLRMMGNWVMLWTQERSSQEKAESMGNICRWGVEFLCGEKREPQSWTPWDCLTRSKDEAHLGSQRMISEKKHL